MADCDSYNEALKEISRLKLQRSELKFKLDRQLETLSIMMDDRALRGGPKFKQARAELDKNEQDYRDVDLLYNIMIIKMAYGEID